MTADNFKFALRLFSQRRVFRPFIVELHTGFRFRVYHPEALILRGELAYYVRRNFFHRLFDATSVCQICDVPFEEPPDRLDLD